MQLSINDYRILSSLLKGHIREDTKNIMESIDSFFLLNEQETDVLLDNPRSIMKRYYDHIKNECKYTVQFKEIEDKLVAIQDALLERLKLTDNPKCYIDIFKDQDVCPIAAYYALTICILKSAPVDMLLAKAMLVFLTNIKNFELEKVQKALVWVFTKLDLDTSLLS